MQVKTFAYHSPEYFEALALRDRVLRQPLGLKFTEAELKKDETDVHFGVSENGKIIACLILSEDGNKQMKMRQVAVAAHCQNKGVGSLLSKAAEEYARQKGFEIMFCHARKTAVPFYEKLGYVISGSEFTEVNIPHFKMQKQLV
jgi:predicted GNAT family N-acyltransferase